MARIGDGEERRREREEREKTAGGERRESPEINPYPSGWGFAFFSPEDLIAFRTPHDLPAMFKAGGEDWGRRREREDGGRGERRKNPETISYPSGGRFALFLPEDLIALSQPKTSTVHPKMMTVQPKILTVQPKMLTVHPRTGSPPQDKNQPKRESSFLQV